MTLITGTGAVVLFFTTGAASFGIFSDAALFTIGFEFDFDLLSAISIVVNNLYFDPDAVTTTALFLTTALPTFNGDVVISYPSGNSG